MGLIDRINDGVINKITKAETVRLSYDKVAKIVQEKYILGADEAFLKKIQKTAKGGLILVKEISSKDKRYSFHVGSRPRGLVWLSSKPVWVFDNEENKFYQLDKNLKWKKFYNAVKAAIELERSK